MAHGIYSVCLIEASAVKQTAEQTFSPLPAVPTEPTVPAPIDVAANAKPAKHKGPQLDPRKAKSGLDHAIANDWLVLHESGTFVRHASEHRSFCITSAHPRRAALFVKSKML